eukprot:CAMPEP_0184858148 /NCGR_PEP_ID=MMETSP0580-20130426/3268_1 /TAXON_ID=1118495 /ORGANISM="Dactyliosolen fragilissimus" /LENGTH=1262 /DNA_ID=CAMNT_0027354131 /DNA_START=55 /DNA_END=3843 /DNA_ORIENTATION=+
MKRNNNKSIKPHHNGNNSNNEISKKRAGHDSDNESKSENRQAAAVSKKAVVSSLEIDDQRVEEVDMSNQSQEQKNHQHQHQQNQSQLKAHRRPSNQKDLLEDEVKDSPLYQLIERLKPAVEVRELNQGYENGHGIDVHRAKYLLEASAGNIEWAAALYWDDFVASAVSGHNHKNNNGNNHKNNNSNGITLNHNNESIDDNDETQEIHVQNGTSKLEEKDHSRTSRSASIDTKPASNLKMAYNYDIDDNDNDHKGYSKPRKSTENIELHNTMKTRYAESNHSLLMKKLLEGGTRDLMPNNNTRSHLPRNNSNNNAMDNRNLHDNLMKSYPFQREVGNSIYFASANDPNLQQGQGQGSGTSTNNIHVDPNGNPNHAASAGIQANNENQRRNHDEQPNNNQEEHLVVEPGSMELANVSDDEAAAERLLRRMVKEKEFSEQVQSSLIKKRKRSKRNHKQKLSSSDSGYGGSISGNDRRNSVDSTTGSENSSMKTSNENPSGSNTEHDLESLRAEKSFPKSRKRNPHISERDSKRACDNKQLNDNYLMRKVDTKDSTDESDILDSDSDSSYDDSDESNGNIVYEDYTGISNPSAFLWGEPSSSNSNNNSNDEDGTASNNDFVNQRDESNQNPSLSQTKECSIPGTWLWAGFTLSECTTGLALPAPKEVELAMLHSLRDEGLTPNQQRDEDSLPPLPTFHCGGVSALTSLVTALIYSGASIQGDEVNCNSSKTPFAELSPVMRKREFTQRLADALSSILFVAAKSGLNSRTKSLQRMIKGLEEDRKQQKRQRMNDLRRNTGAISPDEHSEKKFREDGIHTRLNCLYTGHNTDKKPNDPSSKDRELMLKQLMRVRAKLCPVCSWKESDLMNETRIPLRAAAEDDIKITISYTNMKDLKAYVLSNMRSFVSEGGCALFLEAIVLIHGRIRISRLIGKARRKTRTRTDRALLSCNCRERQRSEWERSKKSDINSNIGNHKSSDNEQPQMPPGHDCMSIEFLSLLITGKVHSNFSTWSAEHFGVGLLSASVTEYEDQPHSALLKYPPKPIWIVRGPSCYTTLWNERLLTPGIHDDNHSSKLGQGSESFELVHWNGWNQIWSRCTMRIIPAKMKWNSSPHEWKVAISSCPKLKKIRESIQERKGNLTKTKSIIKKCYDNIESGIKDKMITFKEIEILCAHPEDVKVYPNEFTRWRFDFGTNRSRSTSYKLVNEVVEDSKGSNNYWVPYFRLSARQKLIVERKMAPRVNLAIWSRWPQAAVDKFETNGPSHPIV